MRKSVVKTDAKNVSSVTSHGSSAASSAVGWKAEVILGAMDELDNWGPHRRFILSHPSQVFSLASVPFIGVSARGGGIGDVQLVWKP